MNKQFIEILMWIGYLIFLFSAKPIYHKIGLDGLADLIVMILFCVIAFCVPYLIIEYNSWRRYKDEKD